MSRLRSPRWLTVALLCLLASIGVATAPAAGGSTTSSSHGAKTPSDTTLFSSELKIISSTGRTLFLDVFVDRFSADSPTSTSLQINLGDNAGEDHTWELNVTNASFAYDMANHRGTIHTGRSQIAPLGVVSLVISPHGAAKTRHCGSGNSWVKQPVTLSGTIVFKTHSVLWGRVGSPTHAITFKRHNMVETDYGNLESSCFGAVQSPCAGAVFWNNAGGDHGLFDGGSARKNGKLHGFIAFTNTQSIARPAGAIRDDYVDVAAGPPTITVGPHGVRTVTVHAGRHGVLTGSATLRSLGPATTNHRGCRRGTTKVWNASYTPGTNPLRAHQDIGGSFSQSAQKKGATITHDSN